jgi:hypothetical protein
MASRREGMNAGLMEGKRFIPKAGLEVESPLVVYLFHYWSLDSKNMLSFTQIRVSTFFFFGFAAPIGPWPTSMKLCFTSVFWILDSR